MGWTVKLVYFKVTGKYYAEGEYVSTLNELHSIWDEVRSKLESKTLPGLVQGHSRFIVSVSVPGHPHEHPKLIL